MAKEKPKSNISATSVRQKKVAKEIMENNGTSISAAMRKAGYSDNYAKNPQELTQTKSWQELMDEYLPDDLIARKHNELLNKMDKEGEIDANAVKSGIDLAYKIKGKFAPEQHEHSVRQVKIIKYE
jgi:hypothetical protein